MADASPRVRASQEVTNFPRSANEVELHKMRQRYLSERLLAYREVIMDLFVVHKLNKIVSSPRSALVWMNALYMPCVG